MQIDFRDVPPSAQILIANFPRLSRQYKFRANSLIEIRLNFAICGANLRGKVEGKQGEREKGIAGWEHESANP